MINYWLKRANEVAEKEVLLCKNGPDLHQLLKDMPGKLPVIFTYNPKTPMADDFLGRIGVCHTIRQCKFGIEGVLKSAKKYHRFPLYVLHNANLNRDHPYWVIIYDGSM